MAEIVNLNRFRKERERAAKTKTADENRVKFGRRKDERQITEANTQKAEKALDDKKIE